MGTIFSCAIEGGLAVVRFDVPGEPLNTWTEAALNEFEAFLDFIEGKKSNVAGVLFISGKSNSFHAGANLNFITQTRDRAAFQKVVDKSHQNYLRMENLGIPTLAAIHGPCLGGGYEFALAMTARIATESAKTIIGLPETKVGLFPGGGGTQRLPRLIGYSAIGIILKGENLSAAEAFQLGMIDAIVSEKNDLLKEAKRFLQKIINNEVTLNRKQHNFDHLEPEIQLAREGALKAQRGRLSLGQTLCLQAMQGGLRLPLDEAVKIERKCFLDVATSPEAKGSIHTFFLKSYSSKAPEMIPKEFSPKTLKKFAVLGFGTMGRGIVIEILRKMRVPIVIKDFGDVLGAGTQFVRKSLHGLANKGQLATPVDELCDLMIPVQEWTSEFNDVDLVIEAVTEDPIEKASTYQGLCKAVKPDCLIASNTSTIPISELAKSVEKPDRFCGAHFFSPVWMMELMEIIEGKETSPNTVHNLLFFCSAIKKRPIVCKDHPGFIVNAMLIPYVLKAFMLLESGVSIERIDAAMTDFGLPVGPIRLIDEVGLDILYLALTKSLGQKPPKTIENMMKAGRLGRKKSGKGFFTEDGKVDPAALALIPMRNEREGIDIREIQKMLFSPFIEVAKELLDKKIVNDPRFIDIGAIWGFGFPTDKGGPLKWADLTGLSKQNYGFDFYANFGS